MGNLRSHLERPKHVYLVDDDPDDRFLVYEALMQVLPQVNVVEAMNGQHFFEIVEISELTLPSLIILDVNMPRMNGLETLRQIKSTPSLSMVPVVMYSTSEDPLLIKQAYEIGTSTFVTKPKSFNGLIEMISQITTHFL